MKRTGSDGAMRCSFCHKSQDVVGKLISSPSDYARVYICDECVLVCNSIIDDARPEPAASVPRHIDQPFEIKELLDQYLTGVVTQSVSVSYAPEWRRDGPRRNTGVIVLAMRKPDGRTIFNPPAEMEITEEDYLIAMGSVSDLLGLEVVRSA